MYDGNAARKLDSAINSPKLDRMYFLRLAAGKRQAMLDHIRWFGVRSQVMLAQIKHGWSDLHCAQLFRLYALGVVSWRGIGEACLCNLTPGHLEFLATQPEMAIPTFSETLSASWTSSPSFGGGWGGSTTVPGAGGTVPSARHLYPDGFKLDNGDGVYLGVASFHHDAIPTVEFAIEGSAWLTVPRSKHPTRDVYGHWVYVPASAATADGVAEFRWRITPANGDTGRVLEGGKLTFNDGGTIADKTTYYAKSEFTINITGKSGSFTVGELVYFNESATDKLAATVVDQTASTLTVDKMYPLTASNHLKDINASMSITGQASGETATVDSGYTEPACTSGDPAHTLCQAVSKYGYTTDAAAYAKVYCDGTLYNFRASFAEGQSQNTNGYLTFEQWPSGNAFIIKAPAVSPQEGAYANCDWVRFIGHTVVDGDGSYASLITSTAATRGIYEQSGYYSDGTNHLTVAPYTTTMWKRCRWLVDMTVRLCEDNVVAAAQAGTTVLEGTVDTCSADIFAGVSAVICPSVSNVDPDAFGPTANHTDIWQQRDTATDDNVVVYGVEAIDGNVCQGFFSRGANAATAQAFVNNLVVMSDYPQGSQYKNPCSDFVLACNTFLGSFFLFGLSDSSVTGFWGGADILITQNVFQWVDITDDQSTRGGHTPATLGSGNTNVVWDTNASINYGTTASAVGATGEDLSGVDANWVEGGVADRDWATWFNDTDNYDFRAKAASAIAAETGTPYIVEDRNADLLASTWAMGADQPTPTVSSASPSSIAKGATADITVTGTGFIDGIAATSNHASEFTVNSTTYVSATEVTVNVTGGSSGTAGTYPDALTLTNPDAQTADVELSLTAGFIKIENVTANPMSGYIELCGDRDINWRGVGGTKDYYGLDGTARCRVQWQWDEDGSFVSPREEIRNAVGDSRAWTYYPEGSTPLTGAYEVDPKETLMIAGVPHNTTIYARCRYVSLDANGDVDQTGPWSDTASATRNTLLDPSWVNQAVPDGQAPGFDSPSANLGDTWLLFEILTGGSNSGATSEDQLGINLSYSSVGNSYWEGIRALMDDVLAIAGDWSHRCGFFVRAWAGVNDVLTSASTSTEFYDLGGGRNIDISSPNSTGFYTSPAMLNPMQAYEHIRNLSAGTVKTQMESVVNDLDQLDGIGVPIVLYHSLYGAGHICHYAASPTVQNILNAHGLIRVLRKGFYLALDVLCNAAIEDPDMPAGTLSPEAQVAAALQSYGRQFFAERYVKAANGQWPDARLTYPLMGDVGGYSLEIDDTAYASDKVLGTPLDLRDYLATATDQAAMSLSNRNIIRVNTAFASWVNAGSDNEAKCQRALDAVVDIWYTWGGLVLPTILNQAIWPDMNPAHFEAAAQRIQNIIRDRAGIGKVRERRAVRAPRPRGLL